ncbi:MAG: SEC59/DGK1/VTE5 family protein [Myxacorys chilensis ATA2-1-KO14]|jgi:phytol kinase|nr:SEC59/DGK1/VTE5 family protein [Myxacorys chilensis ATA2-1-KO14]
MNVAIVALWLLLIGLLAEGVNRYTQAGTEIVRKVVHIGTGNVILFAWLLKIPMWVGVVASVFFSAIALLSYYVPILPSINGVGRKSLGTFFYAVSIGVLVAWFWTLNLPQFAAIGILVMTWGDGFAALVGQRFGRHPYWLWDMKKSWEGSLTMAAISFLVSLIILIATQGNLWQAWFISFVIAIVAATLEAFSKFGIDNLTVPIGSAAVGLFLSQFLFI